MTQFINRPGWIWQAIATLALQLNATATSVVPGPWQDMVAASDFAGVVECTGAGLYASRFRVVETWRGKPFASVFTVHGTALVGERYVGALQRMFTQKIEMPSRMPGIGDPIGKTWFPEPDADYHYHIVWGWKRISGMESGELRHAFPEFEGSLDDLRRAVKALPLTDRPFTSPLVPLTPEPLERGELRRLRGAMKETRAIADSDASSQWWQALYSLSYVDPQFVSRRLSLARSTEMGFRWPGELAGAASTMLWLCPKAERGEAALGLLEAREPIVRVVGGVRALVDGNRKAKSVLTDIAAGDGDLAEWANLVLASHNDCSRMARAIDAVSVVGHRRDPDSGPALYSECVLIVLSNCAAASGLPQPGGLNDVRYGAYPNARESIRLHLYEWWKQHGGNATLLPIGTFPP